MNSGTKVDVKAEAMRALADAELGVDSLVLIGLSGGLDSVVLLDVLVSHGCRVVVAHLDHGLRGEESDADAEFTRELAGRYGCNFCHARVSVAAMAEREHSSLESAGREARRRFFARLFHRIKADALALAHHADDQAETVLWNLTRGSGLRGVAGMARDELQEMSPGLLVRVARPLLGLRRAELMEYAYERNLEWREDQTNQDIAFTRNRIRHQVLPVLEQAAGRDAVRAMIRFADIVRDEDALLEELTIKALHRIRAKDASLNLGGFLGLDKALRRRLLYRWMRESGIPTPGLKEVERAMRIAEATGSPSRASLPGGKHVRRRARKLFLE